MGVTNRDVVAALDELIVLTKLEDQSAQSFRVRAYEAARQSVADLHRDVATMSHADLVAVKGIGKSTADKIVEFVTTGSMQKLEALRASYPPPFVELTRIPGLGPKTLLLLRDRLGIEDLDGLRDAIQREQLRDLPGLGAKTEEKIGKAIERLGMHGKDRRTPAAAAMSVAARVVDAVGAVPGVTAVQYCGSLRRMLETIGDVDVVVAAGDAGPVMDRFVGLGLVHEVVARGDTKAAILTREGLQVDLRVVEPASFGAATLYFTGSKAHNIKLRQLAMDRGWLLNEYALEESESGDVVASATEHEIYAALDLEFIPPPLREDAGEIEAAAAGTLPDLVTEADIKGDLHVHTSLSGDGRMSLEKMVAAAAERGLEYIAITDHGENLAINGISREQLIRQRQRIDRLQGRHPELRILQGSELNIAPDGSVDYDPDTLAGLDWSIASVHSHFDLPAAHQTERLITAMHNPFVGAIGHLSGRMLGRRPGIEFDVDAVLDAAEATGCALEINGALERLDASHDVLVRARERNIVFVIDTDAHHSDDFRRVTWGVGHAQRAWIERRQIANTWPVADFMSWVARRRG